MLTSEQRRSLQVARARHPEDQTIAAAAAMVEEQEAALDALRDELTQAGMLTEAGIAAELDKLRETHKAERDKLLGEQRKRVERLAAAAAKSTPAPTEIEPAMRERLLDQFLALPREERTRAAVTLKDSPRLAAALASVDPEDARTLGIPDATFKRAQTIARGATQDPASCAITYPNQTDIDNLQSAQTRMHVVESLTSL